MKRLFIMVLVLFLFLPMQALAMRCGNQIVSIGDSKYTVIVRCGQPARVTQLGWDVNTRGYQDRRDGRCYRFSEIRIVEEWLYIIPKYGINQMYKVLFDTDGNVVNIEWLGEMHK